jgi:hypothetical protein
VTLLRWIGTRLKDLFYGPGNLHLELNRVSVGFSGLLVIAAVAWDMHKGQPIDLGPGGLSGGLAALITASGLGISVKTWVEAKIMQAKGPSQ